MSAEQQLAILPAKEVALAVFSTINGLDPYLKNVRDELDKFNASAPDVKTKKGQDAYRSIAYDLAVSKTKLDSLGKDLVTELKELPKKIDAERSRVKALLTAWQAEVRKPLTDWEAADVARRDGHTDAVDRLRDMAVFTETPTAAHVAQVIADLELIAIDDTWEEFLPEAAQVKDKSLITLRALLVDRTKVEADLAAIAKFNAEQAIRDQQERDAEIARVAAEQASIEAEQRAQAERDAAARREQALIDQAADAQKAAELATIQKELDAERERSQLKLQAEQSERQAAQAKADQLAAEQRAEQQRVDAERRQAQAVEQARLDQIAKHNAAADEIIRQQKAREADQAHKIKIMGAAKEAFIGMNISEELAKAIVLKIARGEVPNVKIHF